MLSLLCYSMFDTKYSSKNNLNIIYFYVKELKTHILLVNEGPKVLLFPFTRHKNYIRPIRKNCHIK